MPFDFTLLQHAQKLKEMEKQEEMRQQLAEQREREVMRKEDKPPGVV